MWWPRRNLFDVAEDYTGPPEGDLGQACVYGILAAIPLMAYGIWCVVTRHAWFLKSRPIGGQQGFFDEFRGQPAVALGLVFFFLGALAHFHWFWGNVRWLSRFYEIGRLASIIGLIVGLGWWIVALGW